MRIVEPHIHGELASTPDIESMALAGVEAVVILTTYKVKEETSPATLFEYYNRLLVFEETRFEGYGIKPFVGLGVPVLGVSVENANAIYPAIRSLLKRPEVVAVGEIGIETGSRSEVAKFMEQLQLADKLKLPVVCHTPPPGMRHKVKVTEQVMNVIKEVGFEPERVIMDHTGEETLKKVLDFGAYAGLSVCADKLPPRDVARIVKRCMREVENEYVDRIIVNSEYGWGTAGYFSVPRAALEMKLQGLKRDEIEKIVWENPTTFYGLKIE